MAKWELGLTAGKVVSQAGLEQMWAPIRLGDGTTSPYGFGWELGEQRGHEIITRSRSTGVEYTRFPGDRLTVIVLTNLGKRSVSKIQRPARAADAGR